ncbi:MAG TPA: PAS domain S-box protein, partial [Thermodesulfobacteriota bacterium]|nr:PAS domain S-box protein [Thermodesulfobacteriota bacterium]
MAALDSGGILRTNQFFESLDLRRNPGPEYKRRMLEEMRARYGHRKIDMVVTMYPEALDFVLKEAADIFPGVPVLALYLPEHFELPKSNRLVIGHTAFLDIGGTFEIALNLFPKAKRVYVVSGRQVMDRSVEDQARRILKKWESRLEIRYLSGMSFEEILKTLSNAPPESIVLLLAYAQDTAGRLYATPYVAARLSRVSAAPIFGLMDTGLGQGIVGGSLINFEGIGAKAGELAIQLLSGTGGKGNLPDVLTIPAAPMFDWRQLKKWNLSEAALPKGSTVINRETTLWDFKYYIFALLAVGAVQWFLIAGLVAQRRRRARADASAKDQLNFERLVSEISAALLSVPFNRIDREIDGALKRILAFFDVSHCLLIKGSPAHQAAFISHGARAEDAPPIAVGGNLYVPFPWTSKRMAQGALISAPDLEALPAEASAERELYRKSGVRSLLMVPIHVKDAEGYAISISSHRGERAWPEESVPRLLLLGGILVGALERRTREEEVWKSERRYRFLHEGMRDAFVAGDLEGRIREFNSAFRDMLGYSEEELRQRTFKDITPEAWHPVDDKMLRDQLLARGYSDIYEKEYRRKDGAVFPVELRSILQRDEAGAPVGRWAIIRDITGRKRAENALREAERKYRELVRYAPAAICEFDLESGKFTSVNDAMCEMIGYSRDELLEMNPVETLGEDDRPRFRERIAKWRRGEEPEREVEYTVVTKEGRMLDALMNISLNADESGKPVALTVVAHDLTERKKMERALAESRAQVLALFDSTDDFIWSVDPETFGLVTFNLGLSDYFFRGHGIKIRAGMTPEDLFPRLPGVALQWHEFYHRALRQGTYATEYVTSAGTNTLLLSFHPLIRDGKAFGISVFGKDISEVKKAENELRRSEERMRLVLEANSQGVWDWNIRTGDAYFSPRYSAMLGYT